VTFHIDHIYIYIYIYMCVCVCVCVCFTCDWVSVTSFGEYHTRVMSVLRSTQSLCPPRGISSARCCSGVVPSAWGRELLPVSPRVRAQRPFSAQPLTSQRYFMLKLCIPQSRQARTVLVAVHMRDIDTTRILARGHRQ
jgi:hypothetical protein